MPSSPIVQEEARKWLAKARADLILAHHPMEPGLGWEDLGFHAQQAAEKALKAVLIYHAVRPPKTHSIEELLRVLGGCSLASPPGKEGLSKLTSFAVEARYPGAGFEAATEEDFRGALAMAEGVVTWAETEISRGRA